MIIEKHKLIGTTSSGAFSVNTTIEIMGMVRQILVKPTTSTTTYNYKLTNSDSIDIYERVSRTGTSSQQTDLPVNGILTLNISNASVDEAFTIYLVYEADPIRI